MWELPRRADELKFLIIARSGEGHGVVAPVPAERLSEELRERLILYGALLDLHDATLVGVALAVQARHREALNALLEQVSLDALPDIEIHDWELGGRR